MAGEMDKMKGKVKEAIGDLTDNEKLQRDGKTDRAAGSAKDTVDKVADWAKDKVDKAKN